MLSDRTLTTFSLSIVLKDIIPSRTAVNSLWLIEVLFIEEVQNPEASISSIAAPHPVSDASVVIVISGIGFVNGRPSQFLIASIHHSKSAIAALERKISCFQCVIVHRSR